MTDPRTSKGARMERESYRQRLRRRLAREVGGVQREVYARELKWVLARQARYDKKKGGL